MNKEKQVLIKTNYNNVFPSAIVQNNKGDLFYVYKVNQKSFYIGKMLYTEFMLAYESRAKGITWKNFCDKLNVKMESYDKYLISDKEAERKEGFLKVAELREVNKINVNKRTERQIHYLWKRFLKKQNYKYINEFGNDRLIILLFDESEWGVINLNNNRYLYDIKNCVFIPFDNKKHKDKKKIIFPKRPTEVKQKIEKAS